MLAAVRSAAVSGVEAVPVWVEADVAPGLPNWVLVGLAASAVREARERVSAALANAGFTPPQRRVTINLAPADMRKDGTGLDLPIALALLVATGQLPAAATADLLAVGELGLDGSVRPVRGVLPVATLARRTTACRLLVPAANADEARLAAPPMLGTAATLAELARSLRAGTLPPPPPPGGPPPALVAPDLADVVGQPRARRALEIAAAGRHNLLLVGSPGAGKTMLARRLPGLLPPLADDERLEVVAVHSVAGLLTPARAASREPPFRAPHHGTSLAGLIGGGPGPRPGEVSLAHRGVLFLDEMLECPRHVLDALRQPLEDGAVTIARAAQAIRFPARFQFVAATNPCPCGRLGDPDALCSCAPSAVHRYRARLSGPLADRLDLHVAVGRVPVAALAAAAPGEATAAVRARVLSARSHAAARGGTLPEATFDDPARRTLAAAAERLRLSARGWHRLVRVARTIADLDGATAVSADAVREALAYRPAQVAGNGAGAAPETT